jgi:hypothetical protein
MLDLHRSATVIQILNRSVRQRRLTMKDAIKKKYHESVFDDNMMARRSRQEGLQRHQDANNELDQILRLDTLNQSASATTLQNALRGNRARNTARNTARTLYRERTINRMQNDIWLRM